MNNPLVLITGASRGIGRAIAVRFAEQGYDIAIVAHSAKEKLQEVAEIAATHHVRCYPFLCDVGAEGAAAEVVDALSAHGHGVDILINNAGIDHIGLLQDTTWQEWQALVSTNLTGCYAFCHEVIPGMVWNHRGRIINISSVWGVCGASCEAAYSATKGGINAFTRALAKELAPSGIQVNAIACGAIDTEMNQWLDPSERTALEAEIPMGRLGRPEEAAELAWQLATGPDYLTGQVIQLDGGWI